MRPGIRSMSASGTTVVFPVPGGATRAAAPAFSKASPIAGRTFSTGSTPAILPHALRCVPGLSVERILEDRQDAATVVVAGRRDVARLAGGRRHEAERVLEDR